MMVRSRLVQRMLPPHEKLEATDSLSMGVGLKRGGFTEEDNRKMRTVFRFDYMGAAEFEGGGIRDALYLMLEDGADLVGKRVPIYYSYTPMTWECRWCKEEIKTGMRNVFIIARKKHMPEVVKRLKLWACDKPQMKEDPCFDKAMTGDWKDEITAPIGWFEIDNGFMWLTNEDMYKGMCWLMEVPVCD